MKAKRASLLSMVAVGCCTPLAAGACIASHNGAGSVDMPPVDCEYRSLGTPIILTDDLPLGTTIEMVATMDSVVHQIGPLPGGALGGLQVQYDAVIQLDVTGTGGLAGFNRTLFLFVSAEEHDAPRNPGDPVQDFDTDLRSMTGQIFGDPDFCFFTFTAGTDNALPSPGHTTLTRVGPPGTNFQVDSFFDVAYEIHFQGCPGSVLEGIDSTTTGTVRLDIQTPGADELESCCCPNGQCYDLLPQDCIDFGGVPGGPNSSCDTTECEPLCPGDCNGDGFVDLADLNLVLFNFGTNCFPVLAPGGGGPSGFCVTCEGDCNGDGFVDLADLNAVLFNFGTNCFPVAPVIDDTSDRIR